MASGLNQLYKNAILPVLRNIATPSFRFAVGAASYLGLLPTADAPSASAPQRFLIVHLSGHIGDTVMLMPMMEALRRAHPTARIECVVETPVASLLRLMPCLDHCHALDLGNSATTTLRLEIKRAIAIVQFYRQTISKAPPTTCIIPRWGCGFRDLMLAYLTRAPERIGFSADDFDPSQRYRDALLTCRIKGAKGLRDPAKFVFLLEQAEIIPEVDLALVGEQPSSSLRHAASTVDWLALANRLGLDPGLPFVVLAPGASAPRRVWPTGHWAEVVSSLHVLGFVAVLLAGAQDAEVARRIYDLTPAGRRDRIALVAGATNLVESTCLLSRASLFMGGDSGPGHLAGALGVPSVILFIAAEGANPNGPSAPERVRPMGQRVVCCRPARAVPPCVGYCTADSAHCIREIQPQAALRAVASLLHNPEAGDDTRFRPAYHVGAVS